MEHAGNAVPTALHGPGDELPGELRLTGFIVGNTLEGRARLRDIAAVEARPGDEGRCGLANATVEEGALDHARQIGADVEIAQVERRGPEGAALVLAGELEASPRVVDLVQRGGGARAHQLGGRAAALLALQGEKSAETPRRRPPRVRLCRRFREARAQNGRAPLGSIAPARRPPAKRELVFERARAACRHSAAKQ